MFGDHKLSVLIADDHDLVREAVKAALESNSRFAVEVVGSLGDVKSFLLENGMQDVILLDLVMPGMAGLSSIREVIDLNAGGSVALFSGNVTGNQITEVLKLGCRGVIPKTLPLRSLPSAIQLVADGEVFVPVSLTATAPVPLGHDEPLISAREKNILQLVAQGRTNKEIAWEMETSEVAIKANMRTICSKLHCSNRASAAMTARTMGII